MSASGTHSPAWWGQEALLGQALLLCSSILPSRAGDMQRICFLVYSCKWLLSSSPCSSLPCSQLQNHCPLLLPSTLSSFSSCCLPFHNTLCFFLFLVQLCSLPLWCVDFISTALSLHLAVPSSLCPLPTHFCCKDFVHFPLLGPAEQSVFPGLFF